MALASPFTSYQFTPGQAILTELQLGSSIIGNARITPHFVYVLPSAGLSCAMYFEVRAFESCRMQSRKQLWLSLLWQV